MSDFQPGCLPHILVLEDDLAWGRLLVAALEPRGRVEWVHSLDDARRALAERTYELVVSDLRLNGREAGPLLAGVPKAGGSPRVLIVSGRIDVAAAAVDCGADAALAKPVRLLELRQVAEFLLAPFARVAPSGTAHTMRVFDADEARAAAAARFAAESLQRGDRTILVLEARLRPRIDGLLRSLCSRADDAVVVPAELIGERVLSDGLPSRRLLHDLAAPLLSLPGDPRPVSLYGEGVEVLASRGLHRAAVQLERLWNEVLPATGTTFLCGFSSSSVGSSSCSCLHELQAEHNGKSPDIR